MRSLTLRLTEIPGGSSSHNVYKGEATVSSLFFSDQYVGRPDLITDCSKQWIIAFLELELWDKVYCLQQLRQVTNCNFSNR